MFLKQGKLFIKSKDCEIMKMDLTRIDGDSEETLSAIKQTQAMIAVNHMRKKADAAGYMTEYENKRRN